MFTLLSAGTNNHKIGKNKNESFLIFSLNLRPHITIVDGQEKNVCPFATPGCSKICVGDNGHFSMRKGSAYKAQVRKTELYFRDPKSFYSQLFRDIKIAIKKADRKNATAVFRLNAYSDINHAKQSERYTGKNIYTHFSDCIFYDYTKDYKKAVKNIYSNYFITYSFNENTDTETVLNLVNSGINVAIVFETIPPTFLAFPVFNGDNDDNRFLDPKGHIIGLKFKGSKKKLLSAIASGFCIPDFVTKAKKVA